VSEFGRVDYLVNCAGIDTTALTPFPQTALADLDTINSVNVRGVFTISAAIAAIMTSQEPRTIETKRFGSRSLGRGSIVNMASAMSVRVIPHKTPYIMAKHALLGFTKSAAMDLNKAGVRVNCVSPTWVQTPLLNELRETAPQIDQVIERLCSIGRAADPDEVAAAVLYLSGPGATYVTGLT
ncbi:NAD(P)-binding protein, partial [Lophiostoma macrostomum CBS 122681]